MANSAQARKRAKQAAKANAHNSAIRSAMRTAVKKYALLLKRATKPLHKQFIAKQPAFWIALQTKT